MNLGEIISFFRKEKGYKQGFLAQEVGISQTYLSLIEKNKKEPKLSLLKSIAKSLEVPLPIIFFCTLEEKDIPDNKKQYYNRLFPKAKQLILNSFLQKHDKK